MIKTATNIVKGVLKPRKRHRSRFPRISWLQEKLLKHQEDAEVKEISLAGLVLSYKRPYELLHTYRELFERELYRFSSDHPAPVIYDCGANIGLSVLYYKQLYPEARIVAFEPDAQNFALLKLNVERNRLKKVDLQQAAVWTSDGQISFEAAESEASRISAEEKSGVAVPSLRLSRLLEEEDSVDFLKMDIEGAEWEVVQDCAGQLHKVKNFFLEYHGRAVEVHKLTRLLQIVQEAGFRVYVRNAADGLRFPFVEQTTGTIYDVQLNLFCYK